MTEDQIKQLHDRASLGENLTDAELSVLQNWYDENDRDEDLLINRNRDVNGLKDSQQQLSQILMRISQSAGKVAELARQNELLRQENEKLRRAVEARLVENAA